MDVTRTWRWPGGPRPRVKKSLYAGGQQLRGLPEEVFEVSQRVTQERICFLKYTVGEDLLFELVASGLSLEDIAHAVDPTGSQGIWKWDLSRFLGGRVKDNTGPTPDTDEDASLRRIRYRAARLQHAQREHARKFPQAPDAGADYLAALRRSVAPSFGSHPVTQGSPTELIRPMGPPANH